MVPLADVLALLEKHEGFRATAYYDSKGYLTIGYGTNLDAVSAESQCQAAGLNYRSLRNGASVTQDQAMQLMRKAARHAMDCALIRVLNLDLMPENVQLAVVDMVYNLGFAGFSEFHRLIGALEAHDWTDAVAEMKNSAWFHQVGQRALDDIALVESAA